MGARRLEAWPQSRQDQWLAAGMGFGQKSGSRSEVGEGSPDAWFRLGPPDEPT